MQDCSNSSGLAIDIVVFLLLIDCHTFYISHLPLIHVVLKME